MEEKNIKIEKKENSVLVKINPKIYPLPIIYQAADVFIDKNFVFLDGDPEKEVLVTIKPKKKENLEKIAGDFNNELLNYSAYFVRAATNRDLREQMLKRAFFTVTGDKPRDEEFKEKLSEKEKIDIGTKVPIFGEESSENIETEGTEKEGEKSNLDADEEAREEEKKETKKTEKPQTKETEEKEEFDLEEITKPWEEQKGKIEDFPKELEEKE